MTDQQVTELVRTALALQEQGRLADAVARLQQASAARPQSADILTILANACQSGSAFDAALHYYVRATMVDPRFAPARQNLGYMLINMGRLDEGVAQLAEAQRWQPQPMNEVLLATSLPIVYESTDDLRRRRERMEREIQRLVDRGLSLDATSTVMPTNFYCAYQGFNDLQVQRAIGRLYRAPQPVARGPRRSTGGRIRVGLLSSYFCDHTIGCLNIGRVTQLDRARFEVVVLSVGAHDDTLASGFKRYADRHVELTGALSQMRQSIVDQQLDILLFADVGMNPITYTLALSRMAPVQCVTWGHPVTTGNASMDYFISSTLLETDEADAHYSEQLIRLANLGTYYYRPEPPPLNRTREFFQLDPAAHLYFCPQTLFKLHPEFDALLAEILRRDPQGQLLLLEGRHPHWSQLVRQRFARTLGEGASRVKFIPPVARGDFLHLNRLADVALDTIHFGGGNTTYEALSVGTPVVTLPGPLLRSRIALALYRKMAMPDCVATSGDHYVELAVRLGTDRAYRQEISERIRAASAVLFDDPGEIRELERFFVWAAEGGETPWQANPSAS